MRAAQAFELLPERAWRIAIVVSVAYSVHAVAWARARVAATHRPWTRRPATRRSIRICTEADSSSQKLNRVPFVLWRVPSIETTIRRGVAENARATNAVTGSGEVAGAGGEWAGAGATTTPVTCEYAGAEEPPGSEA